MRKTDALRIVIPGGMGKLGGILTRHFCAQGHSVTVLTRNVHRSRVAAEAQGAKTGCIPWRTLPWDGENVREWASALEGANVLINLAGRSVNCRYTAENQREILESRIRSTRVLGEAIRSLARPPRVWLNASTATIYRHSFDRAMDEFSGEIGGREIDAPADWRFSIDVATKWEESFFAAVTSGTRKVALRGTMVMSTAPGGTFDLLLRLVRFGLGGAAGNGEQYMSWIHELDFARAVDYLIEHEEIDGVVNVAAPVPLPNREFMRALREAWGIRYGLQASEWMLKVGTFLLRTETELILKSRRVIPGRLLEHGFQFEFPEWPEAARNLVRSVREKSVDVESTEWVRKNLEGAHERSN
jgi:uncharacterized protein